MIDKPAWRAGGPLCPRDSLNYSRDPANLGRARGPGWQQAMAEVLAGCALLLRPGGLLVTVTKNTRRAGRLNDLATATVQLAEQAGLGYLQHVIALHAAVRQGGLVARPSFWQLTQTRKARARGGAEASAVVGKGVGTPALVLHRDPPVGLLGPLVSPPPAGAEAVRLWAAVVAFTTVPGVLELSRPRPQLTAVPGLRW